MAELYGKDPTMPKAPAFMKMSDIMAKRKERESKGGLATPKLAEELEKRMKGKRRGY